MPHKTALLAPESPTPEPRPREPRHWGLSLLLGLMLLLSMYQLSQLRQLQALVTSLPIGSSTAFDAHSPTPATVAANTDDALPPLERPLAQAPQPEPHAMFSNPQVLNELAWAFNQSGSLPFAQNQLDAASAVRVHEFISRLLEQGFVGAVTIDLSAGNFCLKLDAMGQAALAPPDTTLGDCLLSHEAYNLARINDSYRQGLADALSNLQRRYSEQLSLRIRTAPATQAYPEQLPQTNAGQWNEIAQRNNQLVLHLEPL